MIQRRPPLVPAPLPPPSLPSVALSSPPLPDPPAATVSTAQMVTAAISTALLQSALTVAALIDRLSGIDSASHHDEFAAQLAASTHAEVISRINQLDKGMLGLGFEEAEAMRRGRELDVFGPPKPLIAELLQHARSLDADALTMQAEAQTRESVMLGALQGQPAHSQSIVAQEAVASKKITSNSVEEMEEGT